MKMFHLAVFSHCLAWIYFDLRESFHVIKIARIWFSAVTWPIAAAWSWASGGIAPPHFRLWESAWSRFLGKPFGTEIKKRKNISISNYMKIISAVLLTLSILTAHKSTNTDLLKTQRFLSDKRLCKLWILQKQTDMKIHFFNQTYDMLRCMYILFLFK